MTILFKRFTVEDEKHICYLCSYVTILHSLSNTFSLCRSSMKHYILLCQKGHGHLCVTSLVHNNQTITRSQEHHFHGKSKCTQSIYCHLAGNRTWLDKCYWFHYTVSGHLENVCEVLHTWISKRCGDSGDQRVEENQYRGNMRMPRDYTSGDLNSNYITYTEMVHFYPTAASYLGQRSWTAKLHQ